MKTRLTRLGVVLALITVMLSIPVFAEMPEGNDSEVCVALRTIPMPETLRVLMQQLFNCDCPPNCTGD